MEFGENMFCLNNHIMREQSGNTITASWYSLSSSSSSSSWEPSTNTTSNSTLINAFHISTAAETTSAATYHPPLYGGDGPHVHPDPHLTCLKLGKRHYFEDTTSNVANAVGGGKGYYGGGGGGEKTAVAVAVARCQVEGCHVALVKSKEYHRRHKVCEMHSKAPKVVVLGREQRFCQQCSRFHVVSEFDESKRSCRRRLAGHNERRRKSSSSLHSVARNNINHSTQGCALSLLSPPGSDSWLSHADLSIRCSAALHELIAENRAAIMTRQQQQQLVLDRDWPLHQNDALVQEDTKEIHQPEPNYFPQHIFPQTQ